MADVKQGLKVGDWVSIRYYSDTLQYPTGFGSGLIMVITDNLAIVKFTNGLFEILVDDLYEHDCY